VEQTVPQVLVLVEDLEVIRAALNNAFYQNTTLDLLDSYRKLGQRQSHSAMTKALQGCVAKVEYYIASVEEEDEPGE
jgi:hypothetical protein